MHPEAAHGVVGQNSSDYPTVEPTSVSYSTGIDLEGKSAGETLILERTCLRVLSNDTLETRRQWNLADVQSFRLETGVGSCYVQAQVAGQWADVLRIAGRVTPALSDVVRMLNAACRVDRFKSNGKPVAGRGLGDMGSLVAGRQDAATRPLSMARDLSVLMRPFWSSLLLLLGLSLAAVAIEVAPPMLQKVLVDQVLQVHGPSRPIEQLFTLLVAIVGILLLFRVFAMALTVWKGRVASRVGTSLTANLRNGLVRKLNELPLTFHNQNQVGMLMSRVAYDTETLHTLVYHITGGFLLQVMQLFGIAVMLFYLNFKLALLTMLPMPLIVAGSWYFTRYLNPRHHHYWEAVGRQASGLTGMLAGIRVVKAFVQEDREISRFCDSSARLRDSRQTVDVSTSTFTALMGLIFAVGVLAVWYIGGRDVLLGDMTLGSLMAFLAYLAMFYTPLTTIGETTTWFSSFFTATRRIFDLLDLPSEIDERGGRGPQEPIQGRIEFQDVTFGYEPTRPVLKEINLTVNPGEMIGIVGRSGSGKSTLVSLIGRFYELDSGRILLDGIDVRQISAQELRRRIGLVPQDPFLFRGMVAENIAYGNPGATPEQILHAARCADSHDFIMRMPLAYESQLGEGGTGLSGGERQRLSIARALVFDPAILILDEATASIDAESERAICEAIRRFSQRRTTIAIAHRLSTLRDADRLLVFDQGRIIEQGTHDELLRQGGLYSVLASLQGNLRESRRRVEAAIGNGSGKDAGGGLALAELSGDSSLLESHGLDEHRGAATGADNACPRQADDATVCWLDPARVSIANEGHGTFRVTLDGHAWGGVWAVRAFPASHEEEFLSLRRREPSGREVEVGMIHRLADWPAPAVEIVRQSLDRRYLFRRIEEIRQIRTRGHQLVLTALCEGGTVRFELEKPGEDVHAFGSNGLLLVDRLGEYYVISDRGSLPRRQQRLLSLYFGN